MLNNAMSEIANAMGTTDTLFSRIYLDIIFSELAWFFWYRRIYSKNNLRVNSFLALFWDHRMACHSSSQVDLGLCFCFGERNLKPAQPAASGG